MDISVVIPCKNASNWLAPTLASIQQQVHVELEVILVDDGSIDHSCALAQHVWQGCRWPLRILHICNGGVSAARKLGWQAAHHPLVAFLDADDLMLPGRLRAQATLLSTQPGLGHCLCGWQRINEQGETLQPTRPWQEGAGFSLEQALRHKAVLPSAWMLRRQVLEASGGFDPSLSQAEDVDLLLRLAEAGVKGAWVEEVLCGYRVHPGGASRKAHAQAQGLSWVMERRLARLSTSTEHKGLAGEVRYGTRAWLGWHAWHCGVPDLAQQLWISALGLSPLPPALTWVHLAENVVRSAERVGEEAGLTALLGSPTWRALERNWWQRRFHDCLPTNQRAPAPPGDLWWTAILQGQVEAGLDDWARQLHASIKTPARPGQLQLDWHPTAIASWCLHEGPMGTLQQRVIRWCEQLLGPTNLNQLRVELAEILLMWAAITWQEDRRPTLQRLEQASAVWASPTSLNALARLQQPNSTAGAIALRQLAAAAPPPAQQAGQHMEVSPLRLPAHPVFWETPDITPDSCAGPQCSPCIARHLQGWAAIPDEHELTWWQPPDPPVQPTSAPERPVVLISGGQAWLRPPLDNPWHSTHAYSVADASGTILPHLSRRYPQPWHGACTNPAGAPEPAPAGQPTRIHETVVVLVGLSAETYYHWLLEVLPILGLVKDAIGQELLGRVLVWHNGGSAPYVQDTLLNHVGLQPHQLIDAQQVPWIQATQLIAAAPPCFAHPGATAQQWLRQLIAPPQPPDSSKPTPVLWLWRGTQGRRPVFGEADTLAALEDLKITVLDPGKLSVQQQAAAVASSRLVVSAHGGCLSNLVFAAPGTRVLELHNPDYHPPYFHNLIKERRLRWASQPQQQRPPALYRDLLFESPATEPILLEPAKVSQAVRLTLQQGN